MATTAKTKTVTYIGPHDSVNVAGHPEPIANGKPTTIDAALADLLVQGADWTAAKATTEPAPIVVTAKGS